MCSDNIVHGCKSNGEVAESADEVKLPQRTKVKKEAKGAAVRPEPTIEEPTCS